MNLLNITEFYSVMKSAGISKEKMFEKNRIARVVFQILNLYFIYVI